jgi:hypothetical protein
LRESRARSPTESNPSKYQLVTPLFKTSKDTRSHKAKGRTVSRVDVVDVGVSERPPGDGVPADPDGSHGSDHVEDLEEHRLGNGRVELADVERRRGRGGRGSSLGGGDDSGLSVGRARGGEGSGSRSRGRGLGSALGSGSCMGEREQRVQRDGKEQKEGRTTDPGQLALLLPFVRMARQRGLTSSGRSVGGHRY